MKNDPHTEDRWTSRVQKEDVFWKIIMPPEGQKLVDTLANGAWILHLLDTLKTLQVVAVAPKGSLQSFGLNPSRWKLTWGGTVKNYFLSLGDPVSDQDKSKGVYALVEYGSSKVMVVQGATLEILSYLQKFETLRHRRLITITMDHVDEVEVHKNGKAFFYAQRQNGLWAKKDHSFLPESLSLWLERLIHIQIKDFIDDPDENKRLMTYFKTPLYKVIFKDRKGKTSALDVVFKNNEFFGLYSDRPAVIFRLYPEAIRFFDP